MNFNLSKNKRGQLAQVAYLIVILFACALVILLMKRINGEFNNAVDEMNLTYENNTNPNAIKDVQNSWMSAYHNFDYGFVIIVVGLTVLMIFTSFWIPTHPIFMVINFVGIFFLVFLGMIMGNFYGAIVAGADNVLGAEAAAFPLMNFIMSNLPYIAAGIIFVTTMIMYIRGSTQGGNMG